MAEELHILNGDFAFEMWQSCNFTGSFLVWRETYLEGPLPETDDLHIFRKARAEFLSGFEETKEIGCEGLYRYLKKMDEALLTLPAADHLILWFDSCIFDQTILMRIFYLLTLRKAPLPEVFLYCCEGNCLKKEDFLKGAKAKRLLSSEEIRSGAEAWLLFQNKQGNAMRETAETEHFKNMPAMKKALLRCADELPDRDGLNRTQHLMLELLSQKPLSFMEIFKGLDTFEEYPFLGDTACKRYLDILESKGIITCREGIYKIL